MTVKVANGAAVPIPTLIPGLNTATFEIVGDASAPILTVFIKELL